MGKSFFWIRRHARKSHPAQVDNHKLIVLTKILTFHLHLTQWHSDPGCLVTRSFYNATIVKKKRKKKLARLCSEWVVTHTCLPNYSCAWNGHPSTVGWQYINRPRQDPKVSFTFDPVTFWPWLLGNWILLQCYTATGIKQVVLTEFMTWHCPGWSPCREKCVWERSNQDIMSS